MLLDVNLAGQSGLDIVRAIKADPDLAITKVILLSTSATEPSTVEAMNSGADACLIEPFSPRELLARLDETLWLSP